MAGAATRPRGTKRTAWHQSVPQTADRPRRRHLETTATRTTPARLDRCTLIAAMRYVGRTAPISSVRLRGARSESSEASHAATEAGVRADLQVALIAERGRSADGNRARTRRYGGKSDRSSGCSCRSRKECSACAQYAPKSAPLCCIEPGQAGIGLFTARESFVLVLDPHADSGRSFPVGFLRQEFRVGKAAAADLHEGQAG